MMIRLFVLTLGLALSLTACSTENSSDACAPFDDTVDVDSYRELGPCAAGVTTLTLADREVEVWYPTNPADVAGLEPYSYFIRDALSEPLQSVVPEDINPPFVSDAFRDVRASRQGPFPLVIFAHGASSYRNQSAFLTAHLASWGFVVASVDYLERGLSLIAGPEPDPELDDVELSRMVVTFLTSENEREGALLQGVVSTEQIAITGHSAGGGTSIRFGGEPDVVTYIPLSAGVPREGDIQLPDKPSLWLTGLDDGIVEPQRTIDAFEASSAPTRLVLIDAMGHLGPSDICTIGESGGGVVAIAIEIGIQLPPGIVRLGTDGCQEGAVIEDGWPIIRHFVTSQLRWAFGFDEDPIGLSQGVEELLPEATFTYDESL